MNTQLQQLAQAGQSVWLDYIRRNMFASGDLRRLVDLGLRGMTSNPTIFEKAIGGGNDYDEQLRTLLDEKDPNAVFEALAIADIRSSCDEFRKVFDEAQGHDGFVSLEVSPLLANDTAGTIAAAKRLWAAVDRPNVMIKIPGTPACVPAIEEATFAGINVNVTLLFSLEQYDAAANAFIRGMERRRAAGLPVDRIASVASVFVSRIDTAVDKQLDEMMAKGEPFADLRGKAGIAGLKITYERFRKLFEGDAFAALRSAGAHVQRPLWASTSTKNPAYPDLMYVETVVGKHTVNTMPPATLDALMDHGKVVADTVEQDVAGAHATFEALANAHVSLFDVTHQLQVDGVKLFAEAYGAMLAAIAQKQQQLTSGGGEQITLTLGKGADAAKAALDALASDDFLRKLWKKDPAPWSSDAQHEAIIKHALGWLDFPDRVRETAGDLTAFAREAAGRFSYAVVLGMGGSSLAPDVLANTFGHVDKFPKLLILDSSDPVQIKELEDQIDVAQTLFIVSSKSGTTTEPDAFMRYFFDKVSKAVGGEEAPRHFIAITDPGSPLDSEATAGNFLRVFRNDPDIGGRYSALSYFGMVPAAIAGYDIAQILDRGVGALHASGSATPDASANAVQFGAAIGALAKAGRDKLTIVTHPLIESFGTWCEQLIAESTGKAGTGIVPIEGEPLTVPEHYGDDRVFVYVGQGLPDEHVSGDMDGSAIETRLDLLAQAGHPVIRLAMRDVLDIGAQFATWEIATAAAGSILHIDAFDQPNVQESKDNTKRLLAEFAKSGHLDDPPAALDKDDIRVIPLSGSRDLQLGGDLSSALAAILGQVKPGDYVAITAYIARNDAHAERLRETRVAIRNALKVATTVGFGPRFLHSTGQLHKGGPPSGVFLQLTADAPFDLSIPGMVGFRPLERAQALGDFESLDSRKRRGTRLHMTGSLSSALETILNAIEDAVGATA